MPVWFSVYSLQVCLKFTIRTHCYPIETSRNGKDIYNSWDGRVKHKQELNN